MIAQFLTVLESVPDSLGRLIPTLSDRFNLVLPFIVILIIFAFFLGLKVYMDDSLASSKERSKKE